MDRLLVLLILWVPFSLLSLAAIPAALISVLVWSQGYGKNLLRGMDCAGAGVLGLNSRYTISAHCGVPTRAWLKPLRFLLDWIQPGHCEGAARKEGLL